MSPDRPLALEELPARLWSELVRASRDRHHGWRLPVLATVDPQGSPQARTVVLRGADAAQFPDRSRFVSLHTDGALSSSENAAARLVRYLNQPDFGSTVVDDLRH